MKKKTQKAYKFTFKIFLIISLKQKAFQAQLINTLKINLFTRSFI